MFELFFRYDWLVFIFVGSGVVVWARRKLGLTPVVALGPLLITNSHWLVSGLARSFIRAVTPSTVST